MLPTNSEAGDTLLKPKTSTIEHLLQDIQHRKTLTEANITEHNIQSDIPERKIPEVKKQPLNTRLEIAKTAKEENIVIKEINKPILGNELPIFWHISVQKSVDAEGWNQKPFFRHNNHFQTCLR